MAVGISVASVVDLAARRAQQAARSRAESEILSYLAGSVLRGEDSVVALLDRVRETFAMESVALLEQGGDGLSWHTAASVGPHPATEPEDADVEVPAGHGLVLTLGGRVLPAEDRRVLVAFAAQTAALLERRRLAQQAAESRRLAEGNRIRTALLAAVSHDLRTPLAGIKAAVTSLRSDEVDWSPQDEGELLAGIETGADRLNHLIGNLLDMSRLRTGSVSPLLRDVALDEVVPAALAEVPADAVRLEVPEQLPLIHADTGLLERAVANVVENAVKYSPPGRPVVIRADPLSLPDGDRVEVRVIDRGPGVPAEARDRVFEPFQRYGDAPTAGTGVGLGLAVARGFVEAMGGTLTAEDTPGGGLSMVFTLPTAGPPGGVRRSGPEPGSGPDDGPDDGLDDGPSGHDADPDAEPVPDPDAAPGPGHAPEPAPRPAPDRASGPHSASAPPQRKAVPRR